jgi:primosomal protein N' (replication factor Y)
MNVPDFRAAERSYQLLGDAIDLVQPAASGGLVILQTLLPAHHAIQSLIDWDPARFYEEEFAARQLLGYPPVVHLVSLSVSGKDPSAVEQTARRLITQLEEAPTGPGTPFPVQPGGRLHHASIAPFAASPDRITILGPVPSAGGRPPGHHRRQIMVKGKDRALLHQAVRLSVKAVESSDGRRQGKVTVDVDPIEMV